MSHPGGCDIERRARKRREFKHLSDAELIALDRRIGAELNERGSRRWTATRALHGLDGASAREQPGDEAAYRRGYRDAKQHALSAEEQEREHVA